MKFTDRKSLRIVLACFLGGFVFYAVFSIAYFLMARHQIIDLILTPDIALTEMFSVLILRLILSTLFASLPAHTIIKLVLPKNHKSFLDQNKLENL